MFDVDSKEIMLWNMNDDKILFDEAAEEQVSVASLTKIMTAIVTLENADLEDTVVITSEMLAGLDEFAVAGLQVGQELTVEELLYLTILPSDGDAAQALAIQVAGSIEDFAVLMNQKANELGLVNTHFSNPVGKDDDNYSSAEDISLLLKYALKNAEFEKIFNSFSYFSPTLNKTIYKTIDDHDVITGAKTGFTYAAGRCLASTATIDGVNYLLVNLGADANSTTNHVNDALTIYDYYASNYSYQTIKYQNEQIYELPVDDSDTKSYGFYAEADIRAYLTNNFKMENLDYVYDGIDRITNDNKMGDFLGTYQIYNEGDLLYETSLYLNSEIDFYPYWLWNTGVVCGVIFIIAILVAVFRRRQKIR